MCVDFMSRDMEFDGDAFQCNFGNAEFEFDAHTHTYTHTHTSSSSSCLAAIWTVT